MQRVTHTSLVYLNGQLLPLEQAHISVMDRGFLFGDGVYEVIPVYGGRCFRFDEHLDRLDRNLRETRIPQPHSRAQWQQICEQLIATLGKETAPDQMIYVQVTRGPAPLREHKFPADMQPTVFAFTRAVAPPGETLPAPISAITCKDIRWQRCDIKSISLLANVLMTENALEAGASEALLIRDGLALEGASTNLFAVLDDVLYTAPKDQRILAGITRDLLVELAHKHGQTVREEVIAAADLARATEIWVSSSTREMVPVTTLNDLPVGAGAIGPVFTQMWQWYRGFRQAMTADTHDDE